MRIGSILKDMIYGAGGAIATRTLSGIVSGFVPAAFAGSQLVDPVLQAAAAVTVVRWGGKKFFGQQQGDVMMLGGLISAGLAAADKFLPNIQGQLTSIVRLPVATAPPAQIPAGMGDVEDVDLVQAGFGDVEDVDMNMFSGFNG